MQFTHTTANVILFHREDEISRFPHKFRLNVIILYVTLKHRNPSNHTFLFFVDYTCVSDYRKGDGQRQCTIAHNLFDDENLFLIVVVVSFVLRMEPWKVSQDPSPLRARCSSG